MNKSQCQELINQQLIANPYLREDITQLTTNARWDARLTCFKLMGGATSVQQYADDVLKSGILKGQTSTATTPSTTTTDTSAGVQINTTANANNQLSTINQITQTLGSITSGSFHLPSGFGSISRSGVLRSALAIFVGIMLIKFIQYITSFVYDIINSTRMVYLKVTVPRGDGKSDREMEKELAKDMKEKISRMAQVYNSLHSIGELSVGDKTLNFLFRKPKITMIYQYEHGQLHFIFATYPEYVNILEGSISAQYGEASIESVATPKYFSKKFSDITVLEPKKDPVYPIKVYKNMPDDPINNIIDSIGKCSNYDTVSVIIPIKPEGTKYNKRAQLYADALYRKDKTILNKTPRRKYIVFPRKIIGFFISGPSDALKKSQENRGDPMIRMVKAQEESLNTMGEEAANYAFQAGIIIASSSDDPVRVLHNVDNLVSTFSIYNDQYANGFEDPVYRDDLFGGIFHPLRKMAATFNLHEFFFKKNILTINALTSIFHIPDGIYNRSPIINWMEYKVLPSPDNLPILTTFNDRVISGIVAEKYRGGIMSDILNDPEYEKHRAVWSTIVDGKKTYGFKLSHDAVLLGVNIYRNKYSPVYIKREDRTRHHYVIGKSGTGKSVFLQTLARQDVRNGDGLCLIDPHGDLAEDMMQYIPKERAKDVIFFDAGDENRPLGLNLYEIDNLDQADRIVNDATEIFLKMFGPEIFGPRIQEYFKYGSLTLLEDFEDRPTILDVPRLFTDDAYREFKVKKVTNAVVRNFWEKTYQAMGDREKQEIIPYFTSKFVSFNTNRLIRNIIGQTKSAIHFREAMDTGKIIIVSLSKGKIWEINAQLLGMILVSQIYNGAMWRANMDAADRRDFYLYVDEFQNFVSGTFADILSEARKYRLSLIMAHQYIAQLEAGKGLGDSGGGKNDVKAAVFGNTGTMQSFKVGAPDAETLEKEYAPVIGPQDIISIANYKAYIKLNIDNSTSRVFSMNAINTKDYKNKEIAAILKEYSAKKYGRKREFVDAEITARLGLSAPETATTETTPETPVAEVPAEPTPVASAPLPETPVPESAV